MGQGIKGQAERLPVFSFVCNKGGKGLNAEPSLPPEHWSAEKAADRCRPLQAAVGCPSCAPQRDSPPQQYSKTEGCRRGEGQLLYPKG